MLTVMIDWQIALTLTASLECWATINRSKPVEGNRLWALRRLVSVVSTGTNTSTDMPTLFLYPSFRLPARVVEDDLESVLFGS